MRVELEHLLAAGVSKAMANKWLLPVRVACTKYGIDTKERIAYFIGQCAHETNGFRIIEENLNYSATVLATVWPKRFAMYSKGKPVKDKLGRNVPNTLALALHRQPEMIANTVYANRMGNGPIESGDGWKHRGMGLKQLTGKDNHKRCGEHLGVDLVGSPETLLVPECAALSAAWFWQDNHLSKFADAGDLIGMTKEINGGLIGLSDRKQRCEAVLKLA